MSDTDNQDDRGQRRGVQVYYHPEELPAVFPAAADWEVDEDENLTIIADAEQGREIIAQFRRPGWLSVENTGARQAPR